jgi:hypothetical protein
MKDLLDLFVYNPSTTNEEEDQDGGGELFLRGGGSTTTEDEIVQDPLHRNENDMDNGEEDGEYTIAVWVLSGLLVILSAILVFVIVHIVYNHRRLRRTGGSSGTLFFSHRRQRQKVVQERITRRYETIEGWLISKRVQEHTEFCDTCIHEFAKSQPPEKNDVISPSSSMETTGTTGTSSTSEENNQHSIHATATDAAAAAASSATVAGEESFSSSDTSKESDKAHVHVRTTPSPGVNQVQEDASPTLPPPTTIISTSKANSLCQLESACCVGDKECKYTWYPMYWMRVVHTSYKG